MYIPLVSSLIQIFNDFGGKWLDKKRAVADGKISIAVATAEASASIAVTKAQAELEWESTMAKASATSWKDEAWTVFFIGILTLSFIPGAETYVQAGFNNIADLPDWFGYAVMIAIGAAFGTKATKEFASLATNKKIIEKATAGINKRT